MGFFKKQPKIATHNESFHADDIFACAALRILLGKECRIVRTRDPKIIENADYVLDVGGVYDPAKKRFDHHMHGGAGARPNGIMYAAFGLLWKEYGAAISGSPEIAARVDAKLVAPIDANDNGMSLTTETGDIVPYTLQALLYSFRPTWTEDTSMYDRSFFDLVPLAEKIIRREIAMARDDILAEQKVEAAYAASADKRLIVLDKAYPFRAALLKHAEPLYCAALRANSAFWKCETVPVKMFSFENRKSFPQAWAGLRDGELAKVTGVPDAVFCHNGRFLLVAKSKEGILALAKLALEAV